MASANSPRMSALRPHFRPREAGIPRWVQQPCHDQPHQKATVRPLRDKKGMAMCLRQSTQSSSKVLGLKSAKLGEREEKRDLTNGVSLLMEIKEQLCKGTQRWLLSETFPRHLPHCLSCAPMPHIRAFCLPLPFTEATPYVPPPWQNLISCASQSTCLFFLETNLGLVSSSSLCHIS